jgi:hypothetical protein
MKRGKGSQEFQPLCATMAIGIDAAGIDRTHSSRLYCCGGSPYPLPLEEIQVWQ